MSDRAYTVAEIDDLRQACERKWLYGCYRLPTGAGRGSRCYLEQERAVAVEEMVRTHMVAGHTAEDLYASEDPK